MLELKLPFVFYIGPVRYGGKCKLRMAGGFLDLVN